MKRIDNKKREMIFFRYQTVGSKTRIANEFQCSPNTVTKIIKEFLNKQKVLRFKINAPILQVCSVM